MSFRHPALTSALASPELTLLAIAADIIGSPDPFQALRHLDCDPPVVAELAARLADSARMVDASSTGFTMALKEISSGWSGAGYEAFAERADEVDREYRGVTDRTYDSAKIGSQVASTLDSYVRAAVDQSLSIAGEAAPASHAVVRGESDEAAETVNEACRTIALIVRDTVQSISDMARELAELA
ncbi:hypothetical protein [Saccharomonospora glauca]|jgi:uncharacterized protein YukE|uniref:WXG repeat protein n=1 Tax=Saccharomonospora glauca K62 TaxID=928724 RepID=I1CZM1_9PSEU|nr:hypothetical protein [Saccharomonospora glauca]EIE98145.1 hypothetical protein SacglDRAFT_01214 [Saccharomonospora glauca K62]